jgi:hypothetical protein
MVLLLPTANNEAVLYEELDIAMGYLSERDCPTIIRPFRRWLRA